MAIYCNWYSSSNLSSLLTCQTPRWLDSFFCYRFSGHIFGCVFSGTRAIGFVNQDLGSNLQYILNYAPQYFASEYLAVGAALPDFSSTSLLVGLAYAVATLAGIVFFTSAVVIIAMPKFRKEIKVQSLILFAIAVSFIIFAAVAYYGVDSNSQSFFGIEGYAAILICFLLFYSLHQHYFPILI